MRKYLSEFIGTAVLVIFGCGSAVAANNLIGDANLVMTGSALALSTLLIAFAFGLSIVAMAYSIGNVSGCHINPAVSTGMLVSGKMTVNDYIGYLISQFLGGIAGAAILALLLGILTFVFVIAIIGVTSKIENAAVAGLVIGLTLTLVHILGIPFTGTSVNPARSFGPALIMLFAGKSLPMAQVWVFIVAPLVGGILAALVYKVIAPSNKK